MQEEIRKRLEKLIFSKDRGAWNVDESASPNVHYLDLPLLEIAEKIPLPDVPRLSTNAYAAMLYEYMGDVLGLLPNTVPTVPIFEIEDVSEPGKPGQNSLRIIVYDEPTARLLQKCDDEKDFLRNYKEIREGKVAGIGRSEKDSTATLDHIRVTLALWSALSKNDAALGEGGFRSVNLADTVIEYCDPDNLKATILDSLDRFAKMPAGTYRIRIDTDKLDAYQATLKQDSDGVSDLKPDFMEISIHWETFRNHYVKAIILDIVQDNALVDGVPRGSLRRREMGNAMDYVDKGLVPYSLSDLKKLEEMARSNNNLMAARMLRHAQDILRPAVNGVIGELIEGAILRASGNERRLEELAEGKWIRVENRLEMFITDQAEDRLSGLKKTLVNNGFIEGQDFSFEFKKDAVGIILLKVDPAIVEMIVERQIDNMSAMSDSYLRESYSNKKTDGKPVDIHTALKQRLHNMITNNANITSPKLEEMSKQAAEMGNYFVAGAMQAVYRELDERIIAKLNTEQPVRDAGASFRGA